MDGDNAFSVTNTIEHAEAPSPPLTTVNRSKSHSKLHSQIGNEQKEECKVSTKSKLQPNRKSVNASKMSVHKKQSTTGYHQRSLEKKKPKSKIKLRNMHSSNSSSKKIPI